MAYLVLGIAIVIGIALAARWYIGATPASILRALKWTSIIGCGLIVIAIILTRHFGWLAVLLPALIPWFLRARQAARLAKNWQRMSSATMGGSGMDPGQTSEIETKYLRMYLIHETGEMNGDVILGKFSGKTLRNIAFSDLLSLMVEIRDDANSKQVLNAYLERYHEQEWREYLASECDPGIENFDNNEMSSEEAYKILGLKNSASDDEIKEAHRRLIGRLHPDHGGSNYLATMLNQAKELLLDR